MIKMKNNIELFGKKTNEKKSPEVRFLLQGD